VGARRGCTQSRTQDALVGGLGGKGVGAARKRSRRQEVSREGTRGWPLVAMLDVAANVVKKGRTVDVWRYGWRSQKDLDRNDVAIGIFDGEKNRRLLGNVSNIFVSRMQVNCFISRQRKDDMLEQSKSLFVLVHEERIENPRRRKWNIVGGQRFNPRYHGKLDLFRRRRIAESIRGHGHCAKEAK
jgi:hypothetical protein